MSNIHKGHRERVRNRYINHGLDCFDDHQVLELLLFYAIPMRDTNELAHKLINEFGSISNLFDAHPIDISNKCGVSENTAVLVSMIPSLARRYSVAKLTTNRPLLNSTRKIGNYAMSLLTGRTVECFYIICLNTQRRLNNAVMVTEGTLDEAPIYPRKIVEISLKYQAASIALAHNHPGGLCEPSYSDVESTRKIISTLQPLNIEVIDHVIVAENKYYSFVERDTLKKQ